ncbi:Nucleolar protein 58, partial [Ophiophagus hannah]
MTLSDVGVGESEECVCVCVQTLPTHHPPLALASVLERRTDLACLKTRPGKHLRGNVLPRVLPAIGLAVAHLLAKASEERVAGRFQKPLLVRGFSKKGGPRETPKLLPGGIGPLLNNPRVDTDLERASLFQREGVERNGGALKAEMSFARLGFHPAPSIHRTLYFFGLRRKSPHLKEALLTSLRQCTSETLEDLKDPFQLCYSVLLRSKCKHFEGAAHPEDIWSSCNLLEFLPLLQSTKDPSLPALSVQTPILKHIYLDPVVSRATFFRSFSANRIGPRFCEGERGNLRCLPPALNIVGLSLRNRKLLYEASTLPAVLGGFGLGLFRKTTGLTQEDRGKRIREEKKEGKGKREINENREGRERRRNEKGNVRGRKEGRKREKEKKERKERKKEGKRKKER